MASGGCESKMSEETFDHLCATCAKKNLTKQAVKYCMECGGYCCVDCVNVHNTFPVLMYHTVLDIEVFLQSPSIPCLPTEKCRSHYGKVLDMYCADHDNVACYTCIAINHKNCKGIHSIPDESDRISKDDELKTTADHLQTWTESLKLMLDKSNDEYCQKLENAQDNCFLDITEQRQEADTELNRLEEEARQKVTSFYDGLKLRLKNAIQKVKSSHDACEEFKDKLKRAEGNKAEKFVCSKLINSALNADRGAIVTIKEELAIFTKDDILSFAADKSLIESLKQQKQLGTVTINDKTENRLYKLKHSQDITVRVPDDTDTCSILGCCLLDDTTLLVADCKNRKLKRINTRRMSVEDCIPLDYDIAGVCKYQNNEIAVACYNDQMIQFVSVGQTMTPTRQLKMKHRCYDVTYSDNKLYITDGVMGGSLYIYDKSGKLLQRISKDKGGNNIFGMCKRIALCEHSDNMFVTDFLSDRLAHFDKHGNYFKSTMDPDISGAEGICLYGEGNLFVAGRTSNKVVQFCFDGKKRGVVLKQEDGINWPRSLCCNSKTCQLYVTSENKDTINVYDIE